MPFGPGWLERRLLEQRQRDGERLRRRLQSSEYGELLTWLAGRFPFFNRFTSWGDVLAFMREQSSEDPACDEVLRPLFIALAEDRDRRWHEILLVIFWPALLSICSRTASWDDDLLDRWQHLLCAFVEVVERMEVEQCSERFVQKIYNRTFNRHFRRCRCEWSRAERQRAVDPDKLAELWSAADLGFARADLRRWQEREIERLREHRRAGRITEPEFHLLVGTRIYGRRLVDYAREAGLDYEVAKKRLQRAEARVPPVGPPLGKS